LAVKVAAVAMAREMAQADIRPVPAMAAAAVGTVAGLGMAAEI
jgi:hypothetical protein